MKYSTYYHTSFRYFNEIDEVILKYNTEEHKNKLIEYMQTKVEDNLRIVIAAEQLEELIDKDFEVFAAVKEIHPNFAVRIDFKHKEYINKLREDEIPFFFDVFVDSWDELNGFIAAGVSDVYIVNEFAFDMVRIADKCHKNNVKVRAIPNVAQSSNKLNNASTLSSFYIRPEDISIYEGLIDICEFFGPIDRSSVLYKIYTSERWLGNLKELIIGFKEDVPNTGIVNYFGTRRKDCKKRCAIDNSCKICTLVTDFSKTLTENNLYVEKINDKE